MMLFKLDCRPRGVIAVTMILWVSVFALSILSTAGVLVGNDLRSSAVQFSSTNTFMAAEAGVNDALYKLSIDPTQGGGSPTYSITVGSINVDVTIAPAGLVSPKTVEARATDPATNVVRTVELSTHMSSFIGFGGAVLSGNGGFQIDNSGRVTGNVCANGNISGSNTGVITGDVTVADATAGVPHGVTNLNVVGDLRSYSIAAGSNISGDATYATIDAGSLVGGTATQTNELPDLCAYPPIPAFYLDKVDARSWYQKALVGGTVSGDFVVDSGTANNPAEDTDPDARFLGPKVIEGNLIIRNGKTLILNGPVWVTGRIEFVNPGATIRLNASYGDLSDAIVAEDVIELKNNGTVQGSCVPNCTDSKSYLVVASTSSTNPPDVEPANNNTSALYYAPNGTIRLRNGVTLHNVTAKQIHLENGEAIYNDKLNDIILNGSSSSFVRPRPGSWHEK